MKKQDMSTTRIKDIITQRGKVLKTSWEDHLSASANSLEKGKGAEIEVIKALDGILPPFVGFTSGYIFDEFGNESNQIDIIVYDKAFCPKIYVGSHQETRQVPVQHAIAGIEVKSSMNKRSFDDAYEKASSIKKLDRGYKKGYNVYSSKREIINLRRYGERGAFGYGEDEFLRPFIIHDGARELEVVTLAVSLKFEHSGGADLLASYWDGHRDNHLDSVICLDGTGAYIDPNGGIIRKHVRSPFRSLLATLSHISHNNWTSQLGGLHDYILI